MRKLWVKLCVLIDNFGYNTGQGLNKALSSKPEDQRPRMWLK
jgi:hypothetical protein